jgi:hypothetical protein
MKTVNRFVAFLFLFACSQASADTLPPASFFEDGNEIYRYLTGSNRGEESYAIGFIIGVSDVGKTQDIADWRFCIPEIGSVRQSQIGNVVRNWLEKHPEMRHTAASHLIAQALAESFPCAHTHKH